MTNADHGTNVGAETSIKITKRTNRSLPMFMLHHLIKPFSKYLVETKKELPAGSPKLHPPKALGKRYTIQERTVEGVYIYEFASQQASARHEKSGRKRLFYFSGGGWRMPPSGEHWALCAEMARKLPDTIVSMVSYPLAPNSPAPLAFPQLMKMYKQLLVEATAAGEAVVLAGDSSGGNIVLCLCLALLAEDESAPRPTALMVISPSTDCRKANPDMEPIEKHDPILRLPFVKGNAEAWRGDWSASDPRVTPNLADLSPLARSGVLCHGVTGGYDILGPDAILFRDQCEKARVEGEWLEWDKQMHCFPLAWKYKLPESVEGKDWILDVLRRI